MGVLDDYNYQQDLGKTPIPKITQPLDVSTKTTPTFKTPDINGKSTTPAINNTPMFPDFLKMYAPQMDMFTSGLKTASWNTPISNTVNGQRLATVQPQDTGNGGVLDAYAYNLRTGSKPVVVNTFGTSPGDYSIGGTKSGDEGKNQFIGGGDEGFAYMQNPITGGGGGGYSGGGYGGYSGGTGASMALITWRV
jgi:hypothetical protein